MALSILGLGTAVPPHCMTQADALKMATDIVCQSDREVRVMRQLIRWSGVEQRQTCVPYTLAYEYLPHAPGDEVYRGPSTQERMRLYALHSPSLGIAAARSALENAGVDPGSITHLVTVSCTGFDAPGVDIALIEQLGLPPTTQRVHVGYMGCHGAINGLRVVHGLASAEPRGCVLMCAVELCSLHVRFHWENEHIIANALFGDGAAALVGRFADGRPYSSPGRGPTMQATGSCLIPDSRDAMSWRIGDHGFEMRLTSEVPQLIETHLRPWLTAWLEQRGTSLDQIGSWAVHPGGPRILAAVESSLGLTRDDTRLSREILSRYGNMSSPTILFILEQHILQQTKRPCVALGFGPGLIAEAALFD